MPFTLAHPAAVLPLHRLTAGALPLTALAAGSLAPDFVYYVPFGVNGRYSHGYAGLFLFCMPAGLLAWLLFHIVFSRPLAALLPDDLFRRLPACALAPGGWQAAHPRPVLLALGLGALTHIVWDVFTHRDTVIAHRLVLLQVTVWTGGGFDLPLYKLLQHASSAGGISIWMHALWRWTQRAPVVRPPGASLPVRGKAAACAAIATLACSHGYHSLLAAMPAGVEHLAVRAVVGAVTGAVLSLLVFCLVWHAINVVRRLPARL